MRMAYVHPDEELVLPKIEKIVLYLTESSQLMHVVCYLTNFIRNVSYLEIQSASIYYFEENLLRMDYKVVLDILSQKLPNLKELLYDYYGSIGDQFEFEGQFLQRIQSNLKIFNKYSNLFKFNEKCVWKNLYDNAPRC